MRTFTFRGLTFRELDPFGLEVQHDDKWFWVDFGNREELEQCQESEIEIWLSETRQYSGHISFPDSIVQNGIYKLF